MITLDEMIDNAFNQPPEPHWRVVEATDISLVEMQALHEARRNGTLNLGIYVSPQEYAKQYLAKSKQTLFWSIMNTLK